MEAIEWIRFFLAAGCLLFGMSIFFLEIFGTYRFHYVLNRMHAAALGDTLGIGLSMLGLVILCGWNLTSLKMILVVVFLWIASPVASHMLARFEVATNENLDKDCALPIEKEKQKNKGKGAAL